VAAAARGPAEWILTVVRPGNACLGAWLARAEAQEAIIGLLRRLPKLSLTEQTFEYHPVPSFRSLKKLWVSRG
jgi:cytochrome P450